MSNAAYDILGIGNAIVDIVAPVDDVFLSRHAMHKGAMALVTAEQAAALTTAWPAGKQSSGGSGANTCAVAAGLGARVAYLGTVADDALGAAFRTDIVAAGVHFPSRPLKGGAPTARCLIAVTPDGQRTMNTFLGACVALGVDDLDEALIAASAVTYLEGYLFDPPAAQAAFHRAVAVAHAAGRRVALTLSDPFCVNRHRAAFQALVRDGVDILFANEMEITALYEENDFDAAARRAGQDVALAVLTRSEAGSVIVHGTETIVIPAAPAQVVDTTGAGDAYAAGFLAAHARGASLVICGQLASLAAAAAISAYGARPSGLAGLPAQAGLLPATNEAARSFSP